MVLVPGSLPPAFQNAETDTPQRSLNMTVNGQDGAANTTLTDGTRNVNVGLPHHNVYIAPAETIETVNITTGSMDAEEGMAAGVAITVITKSGTNTFKGSAFEFFNNEKLNATPYYFGRGALPQKLPIKRQTFGGRWAGRSATIGCSSSDRTRATPAGRASSPSSTSRMRRCAMATSATRSMPTARCSGSTTRSPATWPPGTGRSQFANNAIPAESGPPDRETAAGALSAAERRGHGRGRLHGQLPDRTPQRDRPPQLRPESQLEPDARASAVGQIQLHERARRRSVHLPDGHRGWRRRRHESASHHRRADLVARQDRCSWTARSACRS